MNASTSQRGFTIVELLIVIVVIGILAAITIVAYNGVQQRARASALASTLSSAAKTAQVGLLTNGDYPASSALTTSQGIKLTISSDKDAQTFCITGSGSGFVTRNINQSGIMSDGPCEGQSGGASYCPESFVTVNGYYCNGTTGSVATNNTTVVKLDATSSGVPANAPGEYVGQQTSRDNYMGPKFAIAAGETYCVSGWAVTNSSTVTHAIGLHITGPSVSQNWVAPAGARVSPTTTWTKLSGCYTVAAGYDQAELWTQNDGSNGTTASPAWYQTAISVRKQ